MIDHVWISATFVVAQALAQPTPPALGTIETYTQQVVFDFRSYRGNDRITLLLLGPSLQVNFVSPTLGLRKSVVDIANIHKVDLDSTKYWLSQLKTDVEVVVNIRYGSRNSCFANDDGRGSLFVVMNKKETIVETREIAKNCELNVKKINVPANQ